MATPGMCGSCPSLLAIAQCQVPPGLPLAPSVGLAPATTAALGLGRRTAFTPSLWLSPSGNGRALSSLPEGIDS